MNSASAPDSEGQITSRLAALLSAQRSAFLADREPSATVRRDRLDRLVLLLTENADSLADAIRSDFGNRPHTVNLLNDIAGILPDISQTRRNVEKWMRPTRLRSTRLLGIPTVVDHKPLGVVGIIGPWNFPVGLVAQPAASALAAGNRVMIKFSEVTPQTAELFKAKVAEYFHPAEMTVVTGGPETGAAFSTLTFDHLFFTGSPAVGARVAAAAAANLVPVTLELGGKNPAVVSWDADLASTARRVMAARLANGGQICLCPDYAFVPREKVDAFATAALEFARPAASAAGEAGLVSIVNAKNYGRVTALIDDARRLGATVRDTGTPRDSQARRIPPTIVTGVTDEMVISREEVFGPVLSILPYDDIEGVCDYVSQRPSPLAAYWYGPTNRDFDLFRARTTSGGMTVNDFSLHCAMMATPFGGVGQSGWGAYHGKTGFDTFTHRRTVTVSGLPFSVAEALTPPYSSTLRRGVSAYIRFEGRRARRRASRS
jgi:coniferyl-aldehyde dehydrogenase